jgi:hypothetical protein
MISWGGLQENFHQQAVHGPVIQHNLFVTLFRTGRLPGQFQPVEGALSR